MRIKTSELTGAALDYAVAKCEGTLKHYVQPNEKRGTTVWEATPQTRRYSSVWNQCGPIIERERISLVSHGDAHDWVASLWNYEIEDWHAHIPGPTPLIAAMRCYVASKLGDTVDVPEQLTEH